MTNPELDTIVPLIAKLVDGNNLSAQESEEIFTNICLYDQEGYHFVTVLAAIHAKGETADELLGFVRAHTKLGTNLEPKVPANKITDLSGSGGGMIKTLNVSTAASFIVAAAGFTVIKKSFYGATSPTGSADVFLAFGVDIAKLDAGQIEKTLEKVGICPVYHPFISPGLKHRGELAKKFLVEKRIRVRTPLHLVSNAYPITPMKYRIYGMYSEKYLETLAELFQKLGYEKTLTFHGTGGLPEVSNIGKTTVVEQVDKKLKRYILAPNDLGIKKVNVDQIKTGGKEQNIIDFLRILQGKEKGPKGDLVAINAAASLYVMGESKSIAEAVPLAQRIIKSGEGFKKLEELVNYQGDPKLLKGWLKKLN